jgi:hypothetical protein
MIKLNNFKVILPPHFNHKNILFFLKSTVVVVGNKNQSIAGIQQSVSISRSAIVIQICLKPFSAGLVGQLSVAVKEAVAAYNSPRQHIAEVASCGRPALPAGVFLSKVAVRQAVVRFQVRYHCLLRA